jgi:hypothetical protein
MPVFAHAIPLLDFDGNLHIKQCKCIAALVCNDGLLLVVMPGKLNMGGI